MPFDFSGQILASILVSAYGSPGFPSSDFHLLFDSPLVVFPNQVIGEPDTVIADIQIVGQLLEPPNLPLELGARGRVSLSFAHVGNCREDGDTEGHGFEMQLNGAAKLRKTSRDVNNRGFDTFRGAETYG